MLVITQMIWRGSRKIRVFAEWKLLLSHRYFCHSNVLDWMVF